MNSTTVKQVEGVPDQNPPVGGTMYLQGGGDALIWQRIESYIAYRYTPRQVVWTVEGEGDWTPPLSPAMVTGAEKWEGGAWVSVSLPEGPYGYCLPSDGPYRITATVGGGAVPAMVQEAVDRLAKYVAAIQRTAGEQLAMRKIAKNGHETAPIRQTPAQDAVRVQNVDGSVEYAANWPAKALQLSGAADLLRNYRRAQ